MKNSRKISIIISVTFLAVSGITGYIFREGTQFLKTKPPSMQPVTIGYFHGGRTMILYRAYLSGEFEKEGVPVQIVTNLIDQGNFVPLPSTKDDFDEIDFDNRVMGKDLIQEVGRGSFDGATPGESSFIKSVVEGSPIVAVAELGHAGEDRQPHAILFRSGLEIKTPADIKGKILATRHGGGGDSVFLREFLASEGIELSDVTIFDQVPDEELYDALKEGTIDGGFFHLERSKRLVTGGYAYIYRKFNWVDPALSQSLLVFHRDFVQNHPDQVERIVRVYMKRIKYEQGLSPEERLTDPGGDLFQKGSRIDADFEGLDFPKYAFPPRVRQELLNTMQDLLFKYGYIDRKVDLGQFIDNSFVDKIYEELKGS